MEGKSIGTVAREAAIATSAIRYYERIGLLPPPERWNGQRRYDASILKRLKIIRLARQAGFGIRDIQILLHGFPAGTPPSLRWSALSREKIASLDAKIVDLQRMKVTLQRTLKCRCATLEECIEGSCREGTEAQDGLCCRPATDRARSASMHDVVTADRLKVL